VAVFGTSSPPSSGRSKSVTAGCAARPPAGHWRRTRCRSCGSPIYSHRVGKPELVRIRVGTIDEPLNVRPVASYYTGSKCNWWEIHDALPRFEAE